MVEIRAEFAAFDEAERFFRQALKVLQRELDDLEDDLETSLERWEGDDRAAYAVARAKWNKAARDLHAELARLHFAIERSLRNYRNAGATNVRMWTS
ncbi:WXG100 family type VII secretion target [Thermomonospora umbrina]|uniref:WXG100 family type VII secretion target n=1 Tax=Thermomonospora umbrina TaxID=111806 RepID=A0A3D9SL86_9ACTN|nr:WXG100 family type VII secretion target [Thermomonospora umbrina]REE96696.1 WXG100 family type VII secretion target [Thermomonospora umbrina]